MKLRYMVLLAVIQVGISMQAAGEQCPNQPAGVHVGSICKTLGKSSKQHLGSWVKKPGFAGRPDYCICE